MRFFLKQVLSPLQKKGKKKKKKQGLSKRNHVRLPSQARIRGSRRTQFQTREKKIFNSLPHGA